MKQVYKIAEDRYQELVDGTYDFIFIEVGYRNKRVPAILVTVKSMQRATVTITIETIYQTPYGFGSELKVGPSGTEVDIHIIQDDGVIRQYLVHYLRTKLQLGDGKRRDNRLIGGFIQAFSEIN